MKEEFIRTAMLVGSKSIEKLLSARVIVFGLGGVGSYAVEALARAGIGSLVLVDGDVISPSNINRQLYALHSTVGEKKASAAEKRVLDINPDCAVLSLCDFITPENAAGFFDDGISFCVDAIDDTNAKTAIAAECKKRNIPLIASMGTGCKLDPSLFRISDISKTETCPLCRVMRRKYKDAGIEKVSVLWSPEKPAEIQDGFSANEKKRIPSSISFVPSSAGLRIAGYVIKNLIK